MPSNVYIVWTLSIGITSFYLSILTLYRDLKPENIMLDFTGHIALCDFGLCKLNMTESDKTNSIYLLYQTDDQLFAGRPNIWPLNSYTERDILRLSIGGRWAFCYTKCYAVYLPFMTKT